MNYLEVLDFLYTQLPMFQRVGKIAFKKDLSNTIALASCLGNPQSKFKSIHVAGTNGKGSASHLVASVLQSAGHKVGLYTSPHLKSFRERIRINGEEVEKDFVANFVNKNKLEIERISPSFFEITVVMAFEYFSVENVDFAVIETGLGGRLDSTNIITPILSIITSISKDHEEMLGSTIAEIAQEKAGIIKQNVPVVIGSLPDEAESVIRKVCAEKNAELVSINKSAVDERRYSSDLSPQVLKLNLRTVLSSTDQLIKVGVVLSDESIQNGIKHVSYQTGLKGRWQKLNDSPLTLCDVGHNEEAVQWIMSELVKYEYDDLHIVWGMTSEKSLDSIFSHMIRDCVYYFCAANVPRAMDVNKLVEKAAEFGIEGKAYTAVAKAYDHACLAASSSDLIFIGGSTFVVAEINDV